MIDAIITTFHIHECWYKRLHNAFFNIINMAKIFHMAYNW
jgi:hypothetical protein